MTTIPNGLQDASDLLTEDGFAVGVKWYHGTSSGLVASIQKRGLKRSGDKVMKQAAKNIMATIGNSYTESIEPVFLTQSKELAFYWAEQTVKERNVHRGVEEVPVVFLVDLPAELNAKVKPDVGAASLLLVEGNNYLEHLASIYQAQELKAPVIDPLKSDRLDYLNKLGMAYLNQDIDAQFLKELPAK